MDQFVENLPLPAQLGIIGVLILWNILTLRSQNKQVQTGQLIPISTVEEERKTHRESYDSMVKLKDEQINAAKETKDEWHAAHELSEKGRTEERATTAAAVDTVRSFGRTIEASTVKASTVGDADTQSGDKKR